MTQRYCYLDENVIIHSFGDQMYGSIVTTGDPNIIPDIRYVKFTIMGFWVWYQQNMIYFITRECDHVLVHE